MKKLYLLLTLLVVSFMLSCNNEGPIDLVGIDPNDEVLWKVREYDQNPGVKIYTPYLPADWCPDGSPYRRPWVMYTTDGVRQPLFYVGKDFDEGYEGYFRGPEIWVADGNQVTVFMKYGMYDCNCEEPNTAAICNESKFAVLYDVTKDKSQAEWVLAFAVGDGKVDPINKGKMRPIRARVVLPPAVRLNENNEFWLDQLEYTVDVGVKEIKWKFPDNYTYYDWYVIVRPELRGTGQVSITDNMDKVNTLIFTY